MVSGNGIYVQDQCGSVDLTLDGWGTTVIGGSAPQPANIWPSQKINRAWRNHSLEKLGQAQSMIKNFIILALVTINGIFGWTLFQEIQPADAPALSGTQAAVVNQTPESLDSEIQGSFAKGFVAKQARQILSIDSDYESLIDQLRDAGYDEPLLRQIILATINRDHLLLQSNVAKAPYWQPVNKDPEEKLTKQTAWEADRRQQLLDLFGTDIVDDPMFEEIFKPLNDSLAFLSSEKQIKLYELQRHDEAKSQNLFSGGFTQETREDLQAQRQNLQRQIAELLGTTETFEYQMRESRLADRMRQGLNDFDYSEQEFREIFTIRQENEGVDFSRFSNRADFRVQREQSEARIQDFLGPSRYEEYARSQDPSYRSLQSIGERYGNSTAEINEIYAISLDASDQISQLRDSSSLSREDRQQRTGEIRQESFDKIERIAGKETADSVKENSRRMGFGGRVRPGG